LHSLLFEAFAAAEFSLALSVFSVDVPPLAAAAFFAFFSCACVFWAPRALLAYRRTAVVVGGVGVRRRLRVVATNFRKSSSLPLFLRTQLAAARNCIL